MVRRATWLPMVPDITKSAASWPTKSATYCWKDTVVSSSSAVQSPSVVLTIASSIGNVGLVKISDRKSMDDSLLSVHDRLGKHCALPAVSFDGMSPLSPSGMPESLAGFDGAVCLDPCDRD